MFDMVSKPNDWTKRIKFQVESTELTDLNKFQLEYWTSFKDFLDKNCKSLKLKKAIPRRWVSYGIGRSGFDLCSTILTNRNKMRVEFLIYKDQEKAIFNKLKADFYENSLSTLGKELKWDDQSSKKLSWIYLAEDAEISNKSKWPEQFEWIKTTLEKFDSYFRPLIKEI